MNKEKQNGEGRGDEFRYLPLTDLEWTTCWMAIRYAMNRQTIAATTLPQDIIRSYYCRFAEWQKKSIVKELEKNERDFKDFLTVTPFGHPDIDRPHWLRFWQALNTESHFNVLLTDGEIITCFKVGERVYPLNKYVESPHREIYLDLTKIHP
jgi:transposase